MFKKIINLAIVAMLVATVSVMAAPRQGLSDDEKEALKAYQEEMQKFGQTQIHPKLLEIKNNFDKSISKSDLEKLNDLRNNATNNRQNAMQQMQNNRKNGQGGPRQRMDSTQMAQRRAEMEANKTEIDKIIKNNQKQFDKLKSDLEKLQNEINPQIDKLHNELLEKYPELKDRPNLGKNQMLDRMVKSPENFLLWDGIPGMQNGKK
jgi:hypothetical protein